MASATAKPVAIAALVLAVWFGTYWLWEPTSKQTRITFGLPPSPAAAAVATEPAPELGTGDGVAEPVQPSRTGLEAGAAGEMTRTSGGTAAREVVVPPEFTTYTVQKGDVSFEAIARRLGGGSKLAEAIKRSNAFVSPTKLIPGRTQLRIPVDPENIDGKVVRTTPETVPGAGGTPGAEPGDERTHTVAAGETLSGIASKYYKSSASWKLIFDANRDKLDKPERVKVGMVLRIPKSG